MAWRLSNTADSAPATEPVTQAEAKLHIRVDADDENDLIDRLIAAARRYVEHRSQRQLVTATWSYYGDAFQSADRGLIELPLAPVQSITAITYTDTDGNSQTVAAADYTLDAESEPARIELAYDANNVLATWPSTRVQNNAVRIQFVAGYGAAAAVPDSAKELILLLVGHWYSTRQAVVMTGAVSKKIELTVDALLADLRWTRYA